MLQSPPLASMLPFHHAMQVAAAQVRRPLLFYTFYYSLSRYVGKRTKPYCCMCRPTKRPQSSGGGVDLMV